MWLLAQHSRHETLPTVRDITDLWMERCCRPREVHYYDRLQELPIPLKDLAGQIGVKPNEIIMKLMAMKMKLYYRLYLKSPPIHRPANTASKPTFLGWSAKMFASPLAPMFRQR